MDAPSSSGVDFTPAWLRPYHEPEGASPPLLSLPAKDDLDYAQKAITVLFLVLALPWVARELVRRPGSVLRGAGKRHVGG